ncbi:MAG: hypothetical protein MUF54_10540, partial [Polyangiaceae bacterium]|nr:hypothetical protein [Polyangiaceae bacterium]
ATRPAVQPAMTRREHAAQHRRKSSEDPVPPGWLPRFRQDSPLIGGDDSRGPDLLARSVDQSCPTTP